MLDRAIVQVFLYCSKSMKFKRNKTFSTFLRCWIKNISTMQVQCPYNIMHLYMKYVKQRVLRPTKLYALNSEYALINDMCLITRKYGISKVSLRLKICRLMGRFGGGLRGLQPPPPSQHWFTYQRAWLL